MKIFNNMKITKESVKTAGKIVGSVLVYGVVLVASKYFEKSIPATVKCREYVGYSDAVEAIMDSFMTSSDKGKAVKELKTDGDSEYYRAVMRIVDSFMTSGDKVKTIADMK